MKKNRPVFTKKFVLNFAIMFVTAAFSIIFADYSYLIEDVGSATAEGLVCILEYIPFMVMTA